MQRLDRTPPGLADYRAFPGRLTFLSDVNCCVARWAWERVPYREVPYAEDQLLGRELIEAGYAKVFHPDARVLHSHDYPLGQFFKRYFDEFRSLREVLGHVQPWGPKTTLWDVRGLVGADKRWLRGSGRARASSSCRPSPPRPGTGRSAWRPRSRERAPTGSRSRCAASCRSRAGRAFVEHGTSPRARCSTTTPPSTRSWPWEFVRREYPLEQVKVEPRARRARRAADGQLGRPAVAGRRRAGIRRSSG